MLVAVARDGYAFTLINFAYENVQAPPNHPQPHFLKGGDFGCFVPVLFSYLIRFGHTEALLSKRSDTKQSKFPPRRN